MASVPKAYSTRFVLHGAAGYSPDYIVPAGKRVVLKSMIGFNASAGPGGMSLILGGTPLWQVNLPAATGAASAPFMFVAYPGENIRIYNSVAGIQSSVSGYLLTA
jgi:hypothetical protein